MPLIKSAPYGLLSPRLPASRLGVARTLDSRLGRLNHLVQIAVSGAASTVSDKALRVIWSLNPVRDALSDQNKPTFVGTNRHIDRQWQSQAATQTLAWLKGHHPGLAADYEAQFRALADAPGFLDERRDRLGELATFEQRVIAEV